MRYVRELLENQQTQVHIYDVASDSDSVIFESSELLFEAPNWHRDGYLILNGDGKLWKLKPEYGAVPEQITIIGIPDVNNDHVLSPDHRTIYMSAYEDWQIYKAPVDGGEAECLTPAEPGAMYFLHGVSPDETELAYIRIQRNAATPFGFGRVHLYNFETGEDRALLIGSNGAEDGSEYAGDWVYFNTEQFSRGHAQIARARRDGTGLEQLTFDDRVNWFPHRSGDGRHWVYLSYPPGTQGHPADHLVELCIVENDEWRNPKRLKGFNGGQGTINVNSWDPWSARFAYVAYPASL